MLRWDIGAAASKEEVSGASVFSKRPAEQRRLPRKEETESEKGVVVEAGNSNSLPQARRFTGALTGETAAAAARCSNEKDDILTKSMYHTTKRRRTKASCARETQKMQTLSCTRFPTHVHSCPYH